MGKKTKQVKDPNSTWKGEASYTASQIDEGAISLNLSPQSVQTPYPTQASHLKSLFDNTDRDDGSGLALNGNPKQYREYLKREWANHKQRIKVVFSFVVAFVVVL